MHKFAERIRIHRRAKAKLGLNKSEAQDRRIFMEQCVNEMINEGSAGEEDEALAICQMLWDEGSDLGDEYY